MQLLSVEEVRSILALKDNRSVYRLCNYGHLRPVKVGRLLRFRQDDIEELINTSTQPVLKKKRKPKR